jgi:hypothetical protein
MGPCDLGQRRIGQARGLQCDVLDLHLTGDPLDSTGLGAWIVMRQGQTLDSTGAGGFCRVCVIFGNRQTEFPKKFPKITAYKSIG